MTDQARVPQVHRILLVRHAASHVDQARPPREWGLAERGHAASRRLAALAVFDPAVAFYAGPEPKMLQTLAPVAAARGQEARSEKAFGETESDGWLGDETFSETVRRFFAVPEASPAPGWECARAAAERFSRRIDALRALHPPQVNRDRALPGTFVVASGGRALTAYLALLLGYTPGQAYQAWRALRMPDVAVVELSATAPPRIVIPFGTLTV